MTAIQTINDNIGRLVLRQVALENEIIETSALGILAIHPEEHGAAHVELREKKAALTCIQLELDLARRDLVKEFGVLQSQLKMKLNGTLIVGERQAVHNLLDEVEKRIDDLIKILNK